MSELIIFCGLTAKITIPRDIGTKCCEFGKNIFEDTTGGELPPSTVILHAEQMISNFGLGEKANSQQHGAHWLRYWKRWISKTLPKKLKLLSYLLKVNCKKNTQLGSRIILCFLYSLLLLVLHSYSIFAYLKIYIFLMIITAYNTSLKFRTSLLSLYLGMRPLHCHLAFLVSIIFIQT